MLGKLLKYDFKALGRIMVPLQLATLIAGILGSFILNFAITGFVDAIETSYGPNADSNAFQGLFGFMSALMAGLVFAAVFASSYVTLFLLGRHLYKNFLRDEGYLTFTLPVTANQNLLSKEIAGILWMLINAVILLIVTFFMILVGFSAPGTLFNYDLLEVFREMLLELSNPEGFLFMFEILVITLLSVIVMVLQLYFSLILGGSVARSYKVLAGIGFYVLTYFVLSTVMGFVFSFGLAFIVDIPTGDASDWIVYLQAVLLPCILVFIAFIVTFHLVSKYLLKEKLNLD